MDEPLDIIVEDVLRPFMTRDTDAHLAYVNVPGADNDNYYYWTGDAHQTQSHPEQDRLRRRPSPERRQYSRTWTSMTAAPASRCSGVMGLRLAPVRPHVITSTVEITKGRDHLRDPGLHV